MTQDYYQELEVAETASQEEIKNSYRKLAKKYHPDLNQGDPAAEVKFKLINEAYGTVGDPNKRAAYDQQRKFGGNSGGWQTYGAGNADDLFREIFGSQFGSVFGQGFRQPQKNQDYIFTLPISLKEAFAGKKIDINFERPTGGPVNITVDIPPGINHGEQIRYPGYGDHQISGLPAGDLLVQINIVDNNGYHRQGHHLIQEITIDALKAMLGCEIDLTCIDDSNILLKIPAGIQHKANLRVRGKGMPIVRQKNVIGDLIIIVNISIPKNLNEHQQELCRQLLNSMEEK